MLSSRLARVSSSTVKNWTRIIGNTHVDSYNIGTPATSITNLNHPHDYNHRTFASVIFNDDDENEKSESLPTDSFLSSTNSSSSSSSSSSSTTTTSIPQSHENIPNDLPVNFGDISRAYYRIKSGIHRTSCRKSYFLSELIGANVYLKSEFRQFTGSFKERGARNAIMELQKKQESLNRELTGVIAASAGNHALALAYHGQQLGVPVTVVMPTVAPLAKVDKCRSFGCNIVIHGAHIGEAKEHAEEISLSNGYHYVNGYDDPPIVAGAGTMAIEMVEDVPDLDIVVVPVGGAGLIAGVSCAIKTLKPEAKIFGVEPDFCPSYINALKAGKPVSTPVTPTLADGLAVPMVGPHAFEVARHYVDECVTCTEKEIAVAVLRLVENEKMVVEGGGASGLAALLPGGQLDREEVKGKNIVIPLCGGNIDTTVLGRVIDRGLAADHRLCRFVATVSDRPGGISQLTQVLCEVGASIKDIYHERAWLYTNVDQVQVKVVVEMQGKEHAEKLKRVLLEKGYPLIWDDNKCELEALHARVV